ncbi:hypothetical protein [Gorillibacterium sp. sgz5001074]|uniref:hypothetical protein n=1 Tax=Gorillibacterium sp. sgz5001074 TaxID=3446695 RepID=UPI003F6640FE
MNVPKEFPRLREGNAPRPSSPWWMVRSDRLSHPVALVYDNGRIYGLCASPYFIRRDGLKQQWKPGLEDSEFYQYGGYTCSLAKGTVGYTLGYENAPWLFIKATLVKDRAPMEENCFELEAGESVAFSVEIYDYAAESELGVNEAIQQVYDTYHQSPRAAGDGRTAVSDLSKAISKYAWLPEERSYSGFVIEDPVNGGFRYNKIFSLTWTNGLSVAVPVLMAAHRLEDECMREQALTFITNVVEHSLNPAAGLPYETYDNGRWSNHGWWFDGMHTPGHTSYLAGQAMYYILKAYEYEMKLKACIHEDWLAFATRVLEKLEGTKNSDHEYPYILSEKTGAGIEYDAFSGAWCMAAMAYRSWLTGDRTYLDGLSRSENHYYETYVRRMECYGAPLDADKAVDSEGILAYIKAVRYLHALTGDKRYLDHMKDAIGYEFSFKFCYNSPIKIPPLSKLGWSSCGGSVTSVANPHIHPMSSNIVDELLYYVEHTDDSYVRDRMTDTVRWGCQTYNRYDGEFDYGRIGWMSERFCHSEGLLTETYKDGSPASTWFALMPWASSCIIESLAGDYWDLEP